MRAMIIAHRTAAFAVCLGALLACKGAGKSESTEQPGGGLPTAPLAPTSSDVSFRKLVPKVGAKVKYTHRSSSKFTLSGKVHRSEAAATASVDVQGSDQFRIWKGAVDVTELYAIEQDGTAAEKKTVSPLAGSKYVVSRADDGSLSALDSNGAKVPSSQMKLLKDEFGQSFEKNSDAEFLPDRPIKLGEKLVPASDSVIKMLGVKDDGNITIDGVEFILKSANSERASFDSSLTFTQKISTMRLRAKLKGNIDLAPEGAWIVALDLKGPMTILDSAGAEKGTGDFSISASQTTN
jgi:hypothetical protein